MSGIQEPTRVQKVREFRTITRCGLKTAIEAVDAGWKPGDAIDEELTARMDAEYERQARVRAAAPALLEAAIKAIDSLEFAIRELRNSVPDGDISMMEERADALRYAVNQATGEGE